MEVKSAENASLACNITLFSRTYLRGDKFVLGRNNSDSNQTISIGDLSKGKYQYILLYIRKRLFLSLISRLPKWSTAVYLSPVKLNEQTIQIMYHSIPILKLLHTYVLKSQRLNIFAVGFDNKLTSLKVGGGAVGDTLCCFRLYSKPNFEGEDLHFRYSKRLDGKYESAEGMGALFRAASSIQLLDLSLIHI